MHAGQDSSFIIGFISFGHRDIYKIKVYIFIILNIFSAYISAFCVI